ncbi:MAG: putative invasin, partial [Firmicutes bacterium]|nr:putative invasin [Bacillota bacterium]
GWRKLSADKTHIIGLNTFYDYGFQYDLARVGVGAEFFSKIAEYRVNWYCPVSGVKEVDSTSGLSSGAMDGVDVERGYKVLSKIKLTPRVNVEVGYQNLNMNRGAYGRLTYQLGNVAGAALGGVAQTPNRMEFDLTSHFTQKVERENGVTTEMKPASSS